MEFMTNKNKVANRFPDSFISVSHKIKSEKYQQTWNLSTKQWVKLPNNFTYKQGHWQVTFVRFLSIYPTKKSRSVPRFKQPHHPLNNNLSDIFAFNVYNLFISFTLQAIISRWHFCVFDDEVMIIVTVC